MEHKLAMSNVQIITERVTEKNTSDAVYYIFGLFSMPTLLGRNMRSIGGTLTEKIAVEVGQFHLHPAWGGAYGDVIEGTHCIISIENNAGVCISHMVQCIPSKLCTS